MYIYNDSRIPKCNLFAGKKNQLYGQEVDKVKYKKWLTTGDSGVVDLGRTSCQNYKHNLTDTPATARPPG